MVDQLLHSVTHFSFLVLLACAVILFFRGNKDRSTRLLVVTYLVGGVIALTYLLINYGVVVVPMTLLMPKIILGGTVSALLLFYYPVTLIRPGWMNLQYLFFSFVPLFVLILLVAGGRRIGVVYTPLYEFGDIVAHIGEGNVQLRLLMLVTPYLYVGVLFVWGIRALRDGILYRRLVCVSSMGVVIMGFCFLVGSLFFPAGGKLLNQTYIMCYAIVVTYFVLKDTVRRNAAPSRSLPDPEGLSSEEINTLSLGERLIYMLQAEKAYLDSDLTLPLLAARLNTNRTTLAQVLRDNGHQSFIPYLNSLRVEEACRIIREGYVGRIEDLGYRVGFSSKTSFLRNFRDITGTTPGQYLAGTKS